MFHQLPVRESGVCLQDHEGDLHRRTEDVPASQSLFRKAHGLCHTLKRKHRMKPAKLTLMKTLAIFFYNIKFCKAQSWVNFRNILYLSHILVGEFPPFWLPNLICGGIPKDTKKPTNSQHFVYELVGFFILFAEYPYVNMCIIRTKKERTTIRHSLFYVVPPGIEPGTQGFSVIN